MSPDFILSFPFVQNELALKVFRLNMGSGNSFLDVVMGGREIGREATLEISLTQGARFGGTPAAYCRYAGIHRPLRDGLPFVRFTSHQVAG